MDGNQEASARMWCWEQAQKALGSEAYATALAGYAESLLEYLTSGKFPKVIKE